MRRLRSSAPVGLGKFQPELMVLQFVATRPGEPDRGPHIRMNSYESGIRMLEDGEIVWVHSKRRQELATLLVDEDLPRGGVVVQDILGVSASETVIVVKPDSK